MMKKMPGVILLFLILSFPSCINSISEVVVTNNFEDLSGWCNDPQVKFGQGHSGYYYSTTDSNLIYSNTFQKKIKELACGPLKRMKFSVWVRPVQQHAGVRLVMTIERDHKVIFGKDSDLKQDDIELNQWGKIETSCDMPGQLKPEDVLKVFVVNISGKRMDVDDFEIRFKY
jgi:hypothetical protein